MRTRSLPTFFAFISLFLLGVPFIVQASFYPGETLNPSCLPTDSTCVVSGTASGTVGQVPYYAAAGNVLAATSTITILTNGNVGIGTTSPAQVLSVTGKIYTTGGIQFPDGSLQTAAAAAAAVGTQGQIGFYNANGSTISGTSTITILQSGNVGIGTTSPYAKLSVAGQVVGQNFVATSTTANNFSGYAGSATIPTYSFRNQSNDGIFSSAPGYVDIAVGGTSNLTISGAVTSAVPIYGKANANPGIPGYAFSNDTGSGMYQTSAGTVGFSISGTSVVTIAAGSIGTSIPILVTGAGGAAAPAYAFSGPGGSTMGIFKAGSGLIGFSTAGVERMRLSSTGLGIGTTSPYAALSVEGSSALGNSALAGYFTATSTTATSLFNGNVAISGVDNSGGNLTVSKISTATTATGASGGEYGANISIDDSGVTTTGNDRTFGLSVSALRDGSTGGTNNTYAIYSSALVGDPTSGTSNVYGLYTTVGKLNAALPDNSYGLYASVNGQNSYGAKFVFDNVIGVATSYGVHISPASTSGSGMTSSYGLYVASFSAATNAYGLYLENQGTSGSQYAIYSAGASQSYFGGNLGIGTTSPYAKLSVVGEVVAANFTATSTTATNIFSGKVDIGTTTASGRFNVVGAGMGSYLGGAALMTLTTDSGADWNLVYGSNTVAQSNWMGNYMDNGGNLWFGNAQNFGKLGIGTGAGAVAINSTSGIAPKADLDIFSASGSASNPKLYLTQEGTIGDGSTVGEINFYGNSLSTNISRIVAKNNQLGGIKGSLDFYVGTNAGIKALTINSTGNIGIGTTSPYSMLSVAGQVVAQNFVATSTTATSTFAGAMGIGTTTPWRTLSVSGTVALSGLTTDTADSKTLCLTAGGEVVANAGTSCITSSQRFKNTIAPLDDSSGLAEVLKLNPVSFQYNSDIGIPGTQVGLIAEEVQQVDPRLVVLDASSTPFTVRYENLTAVLTKAIQELAAEVSGFAQSVTTAVLNATTVHTDKLCIGSTCVTESQLKTLLQNNAQTTNIITITDVPPPSLPDLSTSSSTAPVQSEASLTSPSEASAPPTSDAATTATTTQ